jgi:hypothetical protein
MAHALLSPSSADRWLKCTPSARLESREDDKAGDAADEGTLAHRLAELILKYRLKLINKAIYKTTLKQIEANKHYTDAMYEYCDEFAIFVLELYADAIAKDSTALIFLETIVDLTEWVPEGFGTIDVLIVTVSFIHVVDFKYGKGVKVDAIENKQMMLYGLGAYQMFSPLFDVEDLLLTIYQPRINNFSTWPVSSKKLLIWADIYLRKQVDLAWAGKGKFVAGDHCQFCRIRTTCKANAEYQQELAKYEFNDGIYLKPKDIAHILSRIAGLVSWANSIKEYALQQAIAGKKWPGYKLIEGKSSRVLTQPEKIKALLLRKGFEEDDFLSKPTLLGITALEKNIGKAQLLKLIGKYINKPEGKPTLVESKDPRPEYDGLEVAKKVFK